MLIGSVSEEGNRMSSRPTEEEWHASLAKAYGNERASIIIATLKKAYPQKKIQTLSYMCSGTPGLNGLSMRNNVVILTCHRFGNRFRIIEIILVGLDERFHELPRDEPHLMSLIAQLGGKEMRARAGFHPND